MSFGTVTNSGMIIGSIGQFCFHNRAGVELPTDSLVFRDYYRVVPGPSVRLRGPVRVFQKKALHHRESTAGPCLSATTHHRIHP